MAVLEERVSDRPRVNINKKMKNGAKVDKNILLVAQEIKLAKILAGNNNKLRDRTIKRLKKWLTERAASAPLTEDAGMRIWKGLFYAMWMSDKPLIQEECAEKISQLIHFEETATSLLFFKCFLRTMVQEWFGIDYLRLDKFLMLVRRVLRQFFEVLKKSYWEPEYINSLKEILGKTVFKLENNVPVGLTMHITEIYLEELAKVSKGKLSEEIVLQFIEPFGLYMAHLQDSRLITHVKKHIFNYLMYQSDAGIEYKEKFNAWKQQGFPGNSIDSMEKIIIQKESEDIQEEEEENESDDEDMPKDPRAGKIDVFLPQLKFDPAQVAQMLLSLRFESYTGTQARKTLSRLAEHFTSLSEGNFPLGLKRIPTVPSGVLNIKHSVNRLQQFEQNLVGDTKRAKERRSKKRKIREIINQELEKYGNIEKNNKNKKQKISEEESDQEEDQDQVFEEQEEELKQEKKKKQLQLNGDRKPNKRKSSDLSDVISKKLKKHKLSSVQRIEKQKAELQFRRNSGIWTVDEVSSTPFTPDKTMETENTLYTLSNKSASKMKKIAANRKQTVSELFEKCSDRLMQRSAPAVVYNPFSTPANKSGLNKSVNKSAFVTPNPKKIKFALNLNRSQEVHEHQAQLIKSPGIPYDASRLPVKPLLKPSPIPSPINPFYKKKFKL